MEKSHTWISILVCWMYTAALQGTAHRTPTVSTLAWSAWPVPTSPSTSGTGRPPASSRPVWAPSPSPCPTRSLKSLWGLPAPGASPKAPHTCGSHLCVITMFYMPAFFSFLAHHFGHQVPRHVLNLLANLYVVVLPILNPIVYGVRTWSIQERVAHLLSLGVSCRGAQLFTGTASNTFTTPHGALCKAGSACHYFHFQLHSSCPWPLEAGVRSRQHVGRHSRGAGGGATRLQGFLG